MKEHLKKIFSFAQEHRVKSPFWVSIFHGLWLGLLMGIIIAIIFLVFNHHNYNDSKWWETILISFIAFLIIFLYVIISDLVYIHYFDRFKHKKKKNNAKKNDAKDNNQKDNLNKKD